MPLTTPPIVIIGAGLAGCECAMTLARHGVACTLFEMKPSRFSPAHRSPDLAELVCSNSLRADIPEQAVGLLKEELRALESLVMEAAEATRVPAGKALAVDRDRFSHHITSRVQAEALIRLERREILGLDDPAIREALSAGGHAVVAAGPLAGDALAADLARLTGAEHLFFHDAIAPIVDMDTVDMTVAWWGSRYLPEEKDYCNCPLTEAQYHDFVTAVGSARVVPCRPFEERVHFEGCLPIEEMVARGPLTLAFGPMKPVGLPDPRTGVEPFAVVQLRPETLEKTAANMVGFQTKLAYPEQERVFRMIPGLERVEFLRLGSMHRNTYVNAPVCLSPEGTVRNAPQVWLAGQISGVEGYVESAAHGLLTGLRLAWRLTRGASPGEDLPPPPPECMLGALHAHLVTPAKHFQPSNVHFGLTPALGKRAKKKDRKLLYAQRAREAFAAWRAGLER